MSKVLKFDRDYSRIMDVVDDRCDDGDYIGALSVLHNLVGKDCDPDIYAQIADIYTQMEMFDTAIFYWFRYMRFCSDENRVDGYNGLGANFYFLGHDATAGYYFSKQMECGVFDDLVYQDVFEDYADDISQRKYDEYKVAYPESDEDRDRRIFDEGCELSNAKNYPDAVEAFSKIGKDSEYYIRSLTEKAYAQFYLDDAESADKTIKKVIRSGEYDVKALTLAINLSALKCDVKSLCRDLELLKDYSSTPEENLKKLNLQCGVNAVDDALQTAEEIEDEYPNVANVKYIKGFLLYNKGEYAAAQRSFSESYIITLNPVCEYYMNLADRAAKHGAEITKIEYSGNLPQAEFARRINIVQNVIKAKAEGIAEKREYVDGQSGEKVICGYDEDELREVFSWSFFSEHKALQDAVMTLIIIDFPQFSEIVFDALVNPTISEEIKRRAVSLICEYRKAKSLCVVYGGIFHRFDVVVPELADEGKELFSKAHAFAFGKVSVIDAASLSELAPATEELQRRVLLTNSLPQFDDIAKIACLIYKEAGMSPMIPKKFVYDLFGVKQKDVDKLSDVIDNKDTEKS